MQFSIVASFTGVTGQYDRSYYPCDVTLDDAIRACTRAGLTVDDPTEPGDSEYSYMAAESGFEPYDTEKPDAEDEAQYRRAEEEEPGSVNPPIDLCWFAYLQDVQVSGILDRETFTDLMEDLGAFADPCETLGTLGGPLGMWVPDIVFRLESHALIDSIHVTPMPETSKDPATLDERDWNRVRRAVLSVYGL